MIYTPSVQTTFLPKNNQLEFHERGAVRAAKGRVFGTKPGGPPAPEPEFDPPIVKDKAQWHIDNKYEVGLEVSAFAATWREGNPETQTYRSRWQTRATSSDAWTNSAWINDPTNQQVRLTFTPTEPGEIRFQSQVRDTTWDPVAQVNSFAAIQNVTAPPLSVVQRTSTSGNTLVGSELTGALASYTGGNPPVLEEYQWQRSADGSGNWQGVTEWTSTNTASAATLKYTTVNADIGMYVRFASKATDADGAIAYGSGNAIGPVVAPTEIGDVSLSVNDVLHEDGGAITLLINDPVPAEIFFTGDADPHFIWEARSGYPLMVGQQEKSTILTFPEAGAPTVSCTLTDSTATDSPISYAVNFYIVDAKTYEELKSNNKL